MNTPLIETHLPFPRRQGKVRDCYDLGETLLIVSTDRISAFDYVMPNGIPDKGRLLTQLSLFWFEHLGIENHLISSEVPEVVAPHDPNGELVGRVMVVRKAKVFPFECIVRGYLEGSGYRDYLKSGRICEHALPAGLLQCDRLPLPLFTPSTKAEEGHDENVAFERMQQSLGESLANQLRELSLQVYQRGVALAEKQGVLIADTKLEWGMVDGKIILVDEVLTPDSSRFWPADQYRPGGPQPSYDKQFVREYLDSTSWDKASPPPTLPAEIVARTREKYIEAYERITQLRWTW